MPSKAAAVMEKLNASAKAKPAPKAKPPKDTPKPAPDEEPKPALRAYVPGGRNPCPKCGATMRVYCTKPTGSSRVRYMKCGICSATDQMAEPIPREELDAQYREALTAMELEVEKCAEIEQNRRIEARDAIRAHRAANANKRQAVAALKAFRQEDQAS